MKIQPIVRNIPNSITLLNLLFGCLSVVAAFEGNILLAGYLIAVATLCDFADGMVARLLKAYSLLGKELDSLADMVSFGVAPSVLAYHLLKGSISDGSGAGLALGQIYLAIPFLLAIFAAIRLAKFNIDTRQTTSFIGLPTPASALLFVGLGIGLHGPFAESFRYITGHPLILIALIVVVSALMVLPLPMFSLKVRSLSISKSWRQYLLLLGGVVLILLMGLSALMPIIVFYLLLSIITMGVKQ